MESSKLAVSPRQWRRRMWVICFITIWCLNCLVCIESFIISTRARKHHCSAGTRQQHLFSLSNDFDKFSNNDSPTAFIDGYIPTDKESILIEALEAAGFATVERPATKNDEYSWHYRYSYSKATGMLRLSEEPSNTKYQRDNPPKWIPIVRGEENVLVANGWSFLDPDENEPLSAFDIDAANAEGQYRPKWGDPNDNDDVSLQDDDSLLEPLSPPGFSLKPLSSAQIKEEASLLNDKWTRRVLLEGATDPPRRKITSNGYNFSGPSSQSDIERGVFFCAIGGLPLFSSTDLSPTTASSGWLSFSRPISDAHVVLVEPDAAAADQRIEVLCAKTKCHLGHYFGKQQGYCINASALNFVSLLIADAQLSNMNVALPVSWRALESHTNDSSSIQLLYNVCTEMAAFDEHTQTIVLAAGCFWSVEHALRRLPGVVCTETGYAGGITTSPTYKDVCENDTQHAEAVRVTFDPTILAPRILVDCFLALHDPTKVRAMGKYARGTGQYRSCIFVMNQEMEQVAREALEDCQRQLDKDLSTELRVMDPQLDSWFWKAEERHQRHDEKRTKENLMVELATLSVKEWLRLYGTRKASVWGSSMTVT